MPTLIERKAHGAPVDPEIVLTDLAMLAEWMVESGGHDLTDLVQAVRAPWEWGETIELVRSIRLHEDAYPGHTCRPNVVANGDECWYCDTGEVIGCGWSSSRRV